MNKRKSDKVILLTGMITSVAGMISTIFQFITNLTSKAPQMKIATLNKAPALNAMGDTVAKSKDGYAFLLAYLPITILIIGVGIVFIAIIKISNAKKRIADLRSRMI